MKFKISLIAACALLIVGCNRSTHSLNLNLDFIANIVSGFGLPNSSTQNWNMSPENTVKSFVQSMANGDCETAKLISVGDARKNVKASIRSGCQTYESTIMSISCDVYEETARCTCTETRMNMNMLFNYDLVLSKDKWKVEYYEKDLTETN